jgi:dihydrofolate synthase/folylpolyglutamate synthase
MLLLKNDWQLNHWLVHLETRHNQEIQLGLSRITTVAGQLKLLTPACKVITVAGTNGKGSTVAALEMIYHTAGYKVGSYTSPHLIHFNERIKINTTPITDKELCHYFQIIEDERKEIPLTYFEMTTLAALLHFKQYNLDVIILEVGMGGRLDATNIIDADVAIITTIDFDHQEFLGTTLEAIGFEKAGIVRSQKPIIFADDHPPNSILEVAKSLNAPIYLYGKHFEVHEHGEVFNFKFLGKIDNSAKKLYDLPRPHIQIKSVAAALTASLLLERSLPISLAQFSEAMSAIFLPGRLQLCNKPRRILYDVSHNPQSAKLLASYIKLNIKTKIHAVFSALGDKDIYGLIFPLKDCVDHWYPALLDNKRAATPDLLLSGFKDAEIFTELCYNSPLIAFTAALSQAKDEDLIVVYGSFYMVSQVMVAQHQLMEQKEI